MLTGSRNLFPVVARLICGMVFDLVCWYVFSFSFV